MQTTYETLRVFISSPSDVKAERGLTDRVIEKINETCKPLGLLLEAETWEKLPPITPKPSEETIQEAINKQLSRCNVFILILYRRYGTVEKGYKKSNTEREIDIAIKMLEEKKRLMFLSYFRKLPKNVDPGAQEKRVVTLRKRLTAKGIFYSDYSDTNDFKDKLTHDIYKTIIRFRGATRKHEALQTFWELGATAQINSPELAVVYPSIDRTFMRQDRPDDFWLRRLVPNVVFEDFKAMEKVEKTLRLIGFRNFNFYATSDMPADISDMNRVWLCLPRNIPGLKQLLKYDTKSKFRFVPRTENRKVKIYWRASIRNRDYITIESPLSLYLTEQRGTMPGGEWKPEMKRIIAKDFAILARFSDTDREGLVEDTMLKDYFIAGIRGLGTWGAAWFIDRRYDTFRKYKPMSDKPIQLLLEVTYIDGSILEVSDVSEQPESYFREQNCMSTVKKIIKQYRAG